jgi:DeoR/GlpR family transcriptional regulator of sugar metabolism
MLATERHAYILDELNQRGVVRYASLADALNVSVMTVRRDIEMMAEQGIVNKVHGGATVKSESQPLNEPPFRAKSLRETESKAAIARAAASYVTPGAALALMGGSTVYSLARQLVGIPRLTIVTNSLPISDLFHSEGRTDQTVILAGGLRTPTDSFVGELTVSIFSRLNIDIAFMGAHGVDQRGGFTSPNLMESETNRAVRAHAKKLVILADHTKWEEIAFSTFAQLKDADVLITDEGLPEQALEILKESIPEVRVAHLDKTAEKQKLERE